MNILLLSGSHREGSYNNTILDYCENFLAEHTILRFPIEELPFYDAELEKNKPELLQHFLDTVSKADAIIFAMPEFNHSVPAVMKNAVDWASRPAFKSPLKGKPYTVMTASPSPAGGIHAQAHLKHILDSTLSIVFPAIALSFAQVHQKVDNGQLVDPDSIRRLERHLEQFCQWLTS